MIINNIVVKSKNIDKTKSTTKVKKAYMALIKMQYIALKQICEIKDNKILMINPFQERKMTK